MREHQDAAAAAVVADDAFVDIFVVATTGTQQ